MKLVFLTGPLKDHRYEVDHRITIGRDASNDIVLPDPAVSLVHSEIYTERGHFFVKDLGSTNGTRVNNERVIGSILRDGDCLLLAKNKIRLEIPEMAGQLPEETLRDAPPDAITVMEARTRAPAPSEEAEADELSGNIFGSVTYYLKRRIATGGMGSIYEAEQFGAEGFIKKVAIKTILPKFAEKASFVSSFVGEAKLVANLVHQNIVQIHHLGRHGHGYYIAMEYIDGWTLTEFMMWHRRKGIPVPVDMASFIVSRVCRGLEYAHGKKGDDGQTLGLVHRDVTPNNIMITQEGEVKLTDFGVAKARHFMDNDEDDFVGSVEYMSPEQAACEAVDGRSDIFTLGLVYYELLTGIRVFQCRNNDIDETVGRVITAEVQDPRQRRDMPDVVASTVMKCLQKEQANRFQTAGELGYALEHEMYSRGYGPTIVVLARYIRSLKE